MTLSMQVLQAGAHKLIYLELQTEMVSAVAKQAGYPRPIMHGLGNFGISGHAVLKTFCGYDPSKLASFACRFSAPVFPGETLRTEMWRDGAVVSFRAKVVERDVIAVNHGRAEVKP